jgi:rRNA-processing protein FCF1
LKQVIFDSSFLMAVVETPTTWFEDIGEGIGSFQPVLLDCVREELDKLSAGQGKKARAARVSLDLASKFLSLPCGKSEVDDEVVSAAVSAKALVATVDAKLAQSLRAAHVPVISLRGGRVALS